MTVNLFFSDGYFGYAIVAHNIAVQMELGCGRQKVLKQVIHDFKSNQLEGANLPFGPTSATIMHNNSIITWKNHLQQMFSTVALPSVNELFSSL